MSPIISDIIQLLSNKQIEIMRITVMILESGKKIGAIENASKIFGGNHAVKSVSLSIASGEILSILGPNGALI